MAEKKTKTYRDLDVTLVGGNLISATLQEGDSLSFTGGDATLHGDVNIEYATTGERVRIAYHAIAQISLRTRIVELPPEPFKPKGER